MAVERPGVKPVFEGIRVLDLSSDIAGSYAAMLLTDMGAATVKTEPPGGDGLRENPGFLVWNRAKKGITVDRDTAAGRRIVRRLALSADVVIESFPGEETGGLDYDDVVRENERLIYCSIPMYSPRGPERGKRGSDALMAASMGVMAGQVATRDAPVYVVIPIVSQCTAIMAAYGITLALLAREATGKGQRVTIPLQHGAIGAQSTTFVWMEGITRLSALFHNPLGAHPTYRNYRCKDGWVFVGAGNPIFWGKLCIALGIEHLVSDPRFEGAPWGMEPEHFPALIEILEQIFREKTVAHWLGVLEQGDVPCAPLNSREQFLSDPQVLHNRMVVEVKDANVGMTRQMGVPVRVLEAPGFIRGGAPLPGQHTDEVLGALGYSCEQIASLRTDGVI